MARSTVRATVSIGLRLSANKTHINMYVHMYMNAIRVDGLFST